MPKVYSVSKITFPPQNLLGILSYPFHFFPQKPLTLLWRPLFFFIIIIISMASNVKLARACACACACSHKQISSPPLFIHSSEFFILHNRNAIKGLAKHTEVLGQKQLIAVPKSSLQNDGVVPSDDDEDGVSLGTMKLPPDTDLNRFESLLFQWANSLCQGANLPLPVPLKVDKISGGARLGFITVGDGKTEVLVYIDCLVFPATSSSGPIFRAIRNGPLKDKPPPGEPRIMRSLLQALQKSVEIARV